jgi:hypothetical protein
MLTNRSDAFDMLADLCDNPVSPATPRDILMEAASTIHHLCDKHEVDYPEMMADADGLYRHQQQRETAYLENPKEHKHGN